MNKVERIKAALKKMLVTLSGIATDKGKLEYDADEIAVGIEVTVDGNPAADGEYKAEDETVYVVKDGKVAEIKPKEEEPAEEPAPEEPVEAEEEKPEEPAPAEPEAEPETEPEAEPESDFDAKVEIEKLKAEVEELKKALAEVIAKPAVPSAEEEFKRVPENGMSRAERIASFLNK